MASLFSITPGTTPTFSRNNNNCAPKATPSSKRPSAINSYAAYQLSQDPLYRSSKAMAEQLGVPDTSVMSIYEINRATQAELDRIPQGHTMTSDEKVEAIRKLRLNSNNRSSNFWGRKPSSAGSRPTPAVPLKSRTRPMNRLKICGHLGHFCF